MALFEIKFTYSEFLDKFSIAENISCNIHHQIDGSESIIEFHFTDAYLMAYKMMALGGYQERGRLITPFPDWDGNDEELKAINALSVEDFQIAVEKNRDKRYREWCLSSAEYQD